MAKGWPGCYEPAGKGFAMTFHVRLNENGAVELPEAMIEALGVRRGDLLAVTKSDEGFVLTSSAAPGTPLSRLREALAGYSVDQFLAERAADWAE